MTAVCVKLALLRLVYIVIVSPMLKFFLLKLTSEVLGIVVNFLDVDPVIVPADIPV